MPRSNFSIVLYWNIYMINNNIVENVIDILYNITPYRIFVATYCYCKCKSRDHVFL